MRKLRWIALVTLVTVYFAARRTARMSIPAAIRNLPEPAEEKTPRRWQVVGKWAVASRDRVLTV